MNYLTKWGFGMVLAMGLAACQTVNHTPASATPKAQQSMKYQHIRNVTAKINYGGNTFLIDPYLAEKDRYLAPNAKARNPTIDMNQSIDEVLAGVDAVIVTHTHADHWDEVAQQKIPKNLPIFVQNAGDARLIRGQGFTDVRVVGLGTEFGKVKLTRTRGQHGTAQMYANPKIAEMLGDAMGVIMQAPNSPTVYLAGDTIWTHEIEHNLKYYQPDVIVLNAGYAKLPNFDHSPIMGTEDVAKTHKMSKNSAKIITVHMDALPQTTISSEQMREFVEKNQLKKVIVPKMGETLQF